MSEEAQNPLTEVDLRALRYKASRGVGAAVHDLICKHRLAGEELTESQLAEVIRQALASGDIVRQVRITDFAQNVVYIPYAESERLKSRIHKLEELLKANGIEESNERDD